MKVKICGEEDDDEDNNDEADDDDAEEDCVPKQVLCTSSAYISILAVHAQIIYT